MSTERRALVIVRLEVVSCYTIHIAFSPTDWSKFFRGRFGTAKRILVVLVEWIFARLLTELYQKLDFRIPNM